MRILHVMPSIAPRLGGPSTVIGPMCAAVAARGHKVTLLTISDEIPSSFPPEVKLITCKPFWFRRKEFIPSLEMIRWLKQNLHEYDLVHCHYLFTFSTSLTTMMCRRLGIPYIVRPLGHFAPWSLSHHSLRKQCYLWAIERKTLAAAACFHATSLGEAEALHHLLPGSTVKAIPLGVEPLDPPKDFSLLYPNTTALLYLGRLHEKKRVELLIDALKHAGQEPSVRFTLVIAGTGSPSYLQMLRKRASALPTNVRVEFVGYVEGSHKAALLHRADIACCVSFHENFAVSVAESLAVGCPVLLTEGVQIAPLVQQHRCGKVVPPQSAPLFEAILSYVKSPEQRTSDGTRGAALVAEQFSWRSIAAQLEDMYSTVLSDTIQDSESLLMNSKAKETS